VSRYQKGKTNLDFTEARDSEWQWLQLGHVQVCTSLLTDNHASTPPLSFFTGRMPFLPPNQQRQSTEGKGPTDHMHRIPHRRRRWTHIRRRIGQNGLLPTGILTAWIQGTMIKIPNWGFKSVRRENYCLADCQHLGIFKVEFDILSSKVSIFHIAQHFAFIFVIRVPAHCRCGDARHCAALRGAATHHV